MKKKTFFKMVAISSVLLITGGILIVNRITKRNRLRVPDEQTTEPDKENHIFGDFSVAIPKSFTIKSKEKMVCKFTNNDHTLLTLRECYYDRTIITVEMLETIYKDQREAFKKFDGPKPIFSIYEEGNRDNYFISN